MSGVAECEPAPGWRAVAAVPGPDAKLFLRFGPAEDNVLAREGVAWSSAEWTPLSRALASVELFAESGSCGDLVLAIELMAVGPAGNLRI